MPATASLGRPIGATRSRIMRRKGRWHARTELGGRGGGPRADRCRLQHPRRGGGTRRGRHGLACSRRTHRDRRRWSRSRRCVGVTVELGDRARARLGGAGQPGGPAVDHRLPAAGGRRLVGAHQLRRSARQRSGGARLRRCGRAAAVRRRGGAGRACGAGRGSRGRRRRRDGQLSAFAAAQEIVLYDMVLVARRPHALYGQRTSTGDEEPAGDVVLRDTTSGAAAVLGSAFAPELAVYAASAAAGLWVGSALTDLTENFEFRRFDGAPVEGFADPTEDLPYNAPPLLVF